MAGAPAWSSVLQRVVDFQGGRGSVAVSCIIDRVQVTKMGGGGVLAVPSFRSSCVTLKCF